MADLQRPRSESGGQRHAVVSDPPAQRVEKRQVLWIPESLDPEDQSLWTITKRVMRVRTPSLPLLTLGGITLSESEKAGTMAGDRSFGPLSYLGD